MEFEKFTSIEGLHNVSKSFRSRLDNASFEVLYRPKIKLHGTNAGYVVDFANKSVSAMKRTQFITVDNDNFGWARWVDTNKEAIYDAAFGVSELHPFGIQGVEKLTVWGEWCGQGVQKGVALAQLKKKIFCPFEVQLHWADGEKTHVYQPYQIDISRYFLRNR